MTGIQRTLDFDRVRAAFDSSRDFRVGIEDDHLACVRAGCACRAAGRATSQLAHGVVTAPEDS